MASNEKETTGTGKSEDGKTKFDDKSNAENSSDYTGYSSLSETIPRIVGLNVIMHDEPNEPGQYTLLVIFNKKVILSEKWENDTELGTDALPINLNDLSNIHIALSCPVIFILRVISNKPAKADLDIFLNPDNKAGGSVDLLPLLLGEEEIFTTLHLVSKATGDYFGCRLTVHATSPGVTEHNFVPLLFTMVSAKCIPRGRDGTVFISAIGLTDIFDEIALEFGPTLSCSDAKNVVWASVSSAGHAANTGYSVPHEDRFVPDDLDEQDTEYCFSLYWNSLNRILVDTDKLIKRLEEPFLIEVAAVPLSGKLEVRGRYLGYVDARALLEPGQINVTVSAQLFNYSEARANDIGPLLNIPPISAKTTSARDSDIIYDDLGHCTYIVIKIDLMEPLIPKVKITSLYDVIGFCTPESIPNLPVNQLENYIKPVEPFIDARFIRKAGGALAVHEELSKLASRGAVPMNQSIKRSAANLLLMRVRALLKNFPPGDCSYIDWQDTVVGQHAASKRAVTASFAPQPPTPRLPAPITVSRCRSYGDERLVQKYISINLKVDGRHPRSLICKILRCLEERNDLDAKNYLFDALSSQVNNRYLLWILGAQEFDKSPEERELASAAFSIAVRGDYSDGTTNTVAWAALHTFYHCMGNMYGAYIAAKQMRKAFSLPIKWKKFLESWKETSGEEEMYWSPEDVTSDNPIIMTAALFLCLRCYKFSERLLQCIDHGCDRRGTFAKGILRVDVYLLRAVSCILRKELSSALEIIDEGIKKCGPSRMMSKIRMVCLTNMQTWNDVCEDAVLESENAGAIVTPSILYKAALARFKESPHLSLQRAARCHQLAPSGHSALLIGRIYARLGDNVLAQRWCAVAVKAEPLLADAWAMLSLLAIQYEQHMEKAKSLLRAAKQAGPISPDIMHDLMKMVEVAQLNKLPDYLVKNMFCGKSNKK